jgi:glycosyltransferase involved in cell wall biosynthesis
MNMGMNYKDKKMEPITLSIIIPTYNSGATLHACLESVVVQQRYDIEVLIMDGDSIDNTAAVANHFVSNYSFVHFFSEPDLGVYDAMNKGIAKAEGEWIYFLGSDDVLFQNNTLNLLFGKSKTIFEVSDIVYGNVVLKEQNILSTYHENFNILNFFHTNICHQAIFYRKSVFNKIGGYEIAYPVFADWEYNMRCFFDDSLRIKYIPDIIAYFSMNGLSNNSTDEFILNKIHLMNKLLQDKHVYYRLHFNNIKNTQNNLWERVRYKINKVLIYILETFDSDLSVVRR